MGLKNLERWFFVAEVFWTWAPDGFVLLKFLLGLLFSLFYIQIRDGFARVWVSHEGSLDYQDLLVPWYCLL